MIKKIETICSGVDDVSLFTTITEIYLFGSGLYKEEPRDIDLLLIHHSSEFQKKFWEQYCEEWRKKPHTYYEEDTFSIFKVMKRTLLRGMRKVDIHWGTSIDSSDVKKVKTFLLAWSRGRPDVQENLKGIEKGDIYKTELTHLRQQLKQSTTDYGVIRRLANALSSVNSFETEKDQIARKLATFYFYKKELPDLEEFAKEQERLAFSPLSQEIRSLLKKVIFYLKLKDNVGTVWDTIRCEKCEDHPIRKIIGILDNEYDLDCGHRIRKRAK
jgi:hypothetical protein